MPSSRALVIALTTLLVGCGESDRHAAERVITAFPKAVAEDDAREVCELLAGPENESRAARSQRCAKYARSEKAFPLDRRQRYRTARTIILDADRESAVGYFYWPDCRNTTKVSLDKDRDGKWHIRTSEPVVPQYDPPAPGCKSQ
jgi:hypothetical protein